LGTAQAEACRYSRVSDVACEQTFKQRLKSRSAALLWFAFVSSPASRQANPFLSPFNGQEFSVERSFPVYL
jgi:hypothetical protein